METQAQQLIDHIASRVDAHWQEYAAPLLLSALGSVDGGQIAQEAKLHSSSLRKFLELEAGDRVSIVQHPKMPTVVGVVPKKEATTDFHDWDFLQLSKTGSKPQLARWHPAIWAAFRKPIPENADRYVLADEEVRFIDVEPSDEIPEGLRVYRSLIAGPEAPPQAVHDKIMEWLDDNKLDISRFRLESKAEKDEAFPRNDLLSKLIAALDPSDLQRTSIPMDVVAKLRRESV